MDGSIYAGFVGRSIRVKMCDDSEFRGMSVAIDAYLNTSLEAASYHADGQDIRRYPSLFIKGSYVDHIVLDTGA